MKEESSDVALEALCSFLDAVEAGISAARETIKNAKRIEEEKLDFDKLFWEKKTGTKGEFEQTSEKANGNSDLWKKLKARLKEHQGFCQYQGFKFWFDMQNENVIDRRKTA
jgi:hypothetical protein